MRLVIICLLTIGLCHGSAFDEAVAHLKEKQPHLFINAASSRTKQWESWANSAALTGACASMLHAYYTHYWQQAASQGMLGSALKKTLPTFAYNASIHTSFALRAGEIVLKAYCFKWVSSTLINWFVPEE